MEQLEIDGLMVAFAADEAALVIERVLPAVATIKNRW